MSVKILDLLEKEKPEFHLKSLTQEVPNAEDFFFKKTATETQGLPRTSYAIGKDVLHYITSAIQPNFHTIETGCGYSTIIFAVHSKQHICANPDITSNRLVTSWLHNHGFAADNLTFIEETSERALPQLEITQEVDMVLIDGSLSFPIPMIDWHYLDLFLRKGGKLLIDNTEINSVRILGEYLLLDPSYRLIEILNQAGRCMVFEKIETSRSMGWTRQEFNKRSGKWISEDESKERRNLIRSLLGRFGLVRRRRS